MINAPNMLLMGSAGRNAGKTTFGCALIQRYAPAHDIVAAKVTTIQGRNEVCPRGGQGCGVCAAFEEDYCITEEDQRDGSKDTQRLLAAGARNVYWLRVRSEFLAEGAAALMERIGLDIPVVCESNSLRRVLAPGLFLLFRNADEKSTKETARVVLPFVDRTVLCDGVRFDLDPADVVLSHTRWRLGP